MPFVSDCHTTSPLLSQFLNDPTCQQYHVVYDEFRIEFCSRHLHTQLQTEILCYIMLYYYVTLWKLWLLNNFLSSLIVILATHLILSHTPLMYKHINGYFKTIFKIIHED